MIWVSRQDHHWFRWWLVAYSVPSHYLNQWWHIVNQPLRKTFQWNIICNLKVFTQGSTEISSVKLRQFCPGLNMLTVCILNSGTMTFFPSHWPLGNVNNFFKYDGCMRYRLWNCPQIYLGRVNTRSRVNVTEPYWWWFNIDSGNGLVSPGSKPLPQLMLAKFPDAM